MSQERTTAVGSATEATTAVYVTRPRKMTLMVGGITNYNIIDEWSCFLAKIWHMMRYHSIELWAILCRQVADTKARPHICGKT